jgi:hypothetical protein
MSPFLHMFFITLCRSFDIKSSKEINRSDEERRIWVGFVVLMITMKLHPTLKLFAEPYIYLKQELALSTRRRMPLTCGTDKPMGRCPGKKCGSSRRGPSALAVHMRRAGVRYSS